MAELPGPFSWRPGLPGSREAVGLVSTTALEIAAVPGSGVSGKRLKTLVGAVEADVERQHYFGASIKVAYRGELVLDLATGFADEERSRPIQSDSVFSVFSITKAFVNVLVLRAVEQGLFALTTKVKDLIPEFDGEPRNRATVFNLLTHTTGMPGVWEPAPGLYLDRLDESVEAVIRYVHGVVEPGERCDYSPMANHTLMAEILRRTDPARRSIAAILEQDLFRPLGMSDTALGIKSWMRERHVVPDMRGTVPIKSLSRTTPGDYGLHEAESNESAWAGAASTSRDLMAFATMLWREGSGIDADILSPATVRLARQIWTGEMPNELYRTVALRGGYAVPPAYLGLGFNIRGPKIVNTQLGTLPSSQTFGNYGAGSALYWVDPERDLVFVGLTAGLLSQAENIARFQRLSDMVAAAIR